jgi:hypothetical protein
MKTAKQIKQKDMQNTKQQKQTKKINTLMNLVQNQRNCNRTYREKANTNHQS